MRSMTNEVYEELNKKKNPIGINRTDVLQHLIDYIFLIGPSKFDYEKKLIIEKIKSSDSVEKI